MATIGLDLILGFTIGLSLGLLGGGGSILTVPALVYLVGQSPQAAVTTSLAIVGANSAIGALFHQSAQQDGKKCFNWQVALIFGGAGMLVSYLAAGLSKLLAPALLMVLFGLLMLLVGGMMILQGRRAPAARAAGQPEQPRVWVTLLAGAGVGLLTGILGVGGGFLIVPALVMLVGLPMYQAVGTSLAIIAANSFAGLLGHIGAPFDVWVTVFFVTAGIVGTFVGAKLSHRLPAQRLRQMFAIFVIGLAIILLMDNLPKLLG